MQEIYYPSSDGKTNIHACIWQAEGEPVAVLQIIHGMAEYADRYAPLAEYLTKHGITVCAEDHLGHGKSVCSEDDLGYFAEQKGYAPVLKDIRALTEIVKEKHPGLPYFVMGHSMGSFFCRKYISLYGAELAGAIVMGTGFKSKATTGSAKFITRLVALFKGWRYRSKFIDNTAFGSYNKKFEKRTQFDWLSANSENVDNYIADPLCGVPFTCNAFYGLFSIIHEACKASTMKAVPAKLPIFIVAGADDPVGDYGKGVEKFCNKMAKYGKDVSMILYRGCRHEIVNDVCAPQLFEDLAGFLKDNINGNGSTQAN
ncbi:MAG: alpha/beta hydrolase [Clostridia bacterium]|nr:alpha/beta hydrolase [Clostridia bacterium]